MQLRLLKFLLEKSDILSMKFSQQCILIGNILPICFLFCFSSYAQSVIKGEVLDANNDDPLIGASILLKGTTTGTVTDYDGAFEIKVSGNLPDTLVFSYTGYETKEIEITNSLTGPLKISLGESVFVTEVVEVKGQRISDKQKASPLTVESLDLLAIKQTASENFYDGLATLKGVDMTAASLGFKIINTRGFNSTSPVRSLQIIDGVDNQAPGLNFSLGNFLGSPELDVLKVDLVVGASSAYYGPGAFNGVISMTTKDPFIQKGLSASVKAGERNLIKSGFRWADAINNGDGQPFFAYKFNFLYFEADDWEADNYDPVFDTDTGLDNPGRFDAVNIYGDEYYRGNDVSSTPVTQVPGLGTWHRTGYREIDLVDYDTRNIKANAALHFRLNPSQAEESPELILASNFGTGTTVYQGDNRFSLRNILLFQNRLELRKRDKYFFRAYATHEDAGDSYDPFFTALKLQEESKTNLDWSRDYFNYWQSTVKPRIDNDETFPQLEIIGFDPETNTVISNFDTAALSAWFLNDNNIANLFSWHSETEEAANRRSEPGTEDFFQPGTERFNRKFNEITTTKRTEGGTLFTDRSALYHAHGEYKFTPTFVDQITVGANARLYEPVSEGTIFYDTAGIQISNFEFGMYAGFDKSFANNKLKAQATIRTDKNENFDWLFSPAASLVWKPSAGDYFRLSFASAIRNPTLADQYLFLDVGPAILSGNLDGVKGLMTIESLSTWLNSLNPNDIEFFDIDPVKPEQVRTLEVGYRSTLFNSLYVDASYYYSIYNNFLGFNLGADVNIDPATGRPLGVQVYRYAANSTNEVTTQGVSIGLNYYFQKYYMISGNYSWNRLNKTFDDDPIIPAYNTPEHKFNIGLSGRDVPIRIGGKTYNNFGFNINYKWIEGFLFEGSPQFTGFIPTYDLLDAQVNYEFDKINTTLKVGASNILDNQQFQTYGGPRIGRLAYVSITYEWNK